MLKIQSSRLRWPIVHSLGTLPHPVELLPAFQDLPYTILLDSATPHPRLGRYSYLTADPFLTMTSQGHQVTIEQEGSRREVNDDPFQILRSLLQAYHMEPAPGGPDLPPFQGGAAGYFAYDLGRLLEQLPAIAQANPRLPDLVLPFYDWVLAHDNLTGQGFLFSNGLPQGDEARARERAYWVLKRIRRGNGCSPSGGDAASLTSPISSNFTHEGYLAAIRRVKEYLAAGDVYQVNLSHRLEATFSGDPWALYQRLRQENPAPFSAYLAFPQAHVLSASPEEFLDLNGTRVETRPIKGTRPRGRTLEEDQRLARELLASEKEGAENVMIVDLLRNDLGRVCRIGSIQVPQLFAVEPHPTVWHLVSTVTGELAPGKDIVHLLRATFPGGSVTGAPKLRAMEIIEELEPIRRGVYCGAIGYLSFSGAMKTSIAIRTMVITNGRLHLQVGGGIVADSEPAAEYEETLHKAQGLLRALGASTSNKSSPSTSGVFMSTSNRL